MEYASKAHNEIILRHHEEYKILEGDQLNIMIKIFNSAYQQMKINF